MDLSIVGAAGACGRQLTVQLLESNLLMHSTRLQLVGHHGGASEKEMWGLRADLEDAFGDFAPPMEVVMDPDEVDGDIVVMLAGRTLSTDPNASADRAALGKANASVFATYADVLARSNGAPPLVVVQSNPVELGVALFADAVGRHRVIGAGAWSDTLRFRREIAHDLDVRRPAVTAPMLGQHGDHLVPAWSQIHVRGIDDDALRDQLNRMRGGRTVDELPALIVELRGQLLSLLQAGEVVAAYDLVAAQSPDLRAALKPFFTHFSAGHTTEVVTARAVADVIQAIVEGHRRVMPVQVMLEGEWQGISGVVGAPVIVGSNGWQAGVDVHLAEDEVSALAEAAAVIAKSNADLMG